MLSKRETTMRQRVEQTTTELETILLQKLNSNWDLNTFCCKELSEYSSARSLIWLLVSQLFAVSENSCILLSLFGTTSSEDKTKHFILVLALGNSCYRERALSICAADRNTQSVFALTLIFTYPNRIPKYSLFSPLLSNLCWSNVAHNSNMSAQRCRLWSTPGSHNSSQIYWGCLLHLDNKPFVVVLTTIPHFSQ